MMEASKPGRRGVTAEDVSEAADALLMEGLRPTVEKVRLKLGGGSPNTVGPHLDAWFQMLGRRIAHPAGFSPERANHQPEPVRQAAEFLWKAAQQEARLELEQEYAARFADLEKEREEVAAQRESLETERKYMQSQVQAVETRMTALNEAREKDLAAHAKVQERLAHNEAQLDASRRETERAAKQLEQQKSLLAEAQHQFRQDRATWDQERQQLHAAADAEKRRLMLEIDAGRVALRNHQSEAEKTERQLQDRLAHAAMQLSDAESAKSIVTQELLLSNRELEALKRQCADAETALQALRSAMSQPSDELPASATGTPAARPRNPTAWRAAPARQVPRRALKKR